MNSRVDSFAPFHYLFCRAPMAWEHEHSSSGRSSMNTLGKMQPSFNSPDGATSSVSEDKKKDVCF